MKRFLARLHRAVAVMTNRGSFKAAVSSANRPDVPRLGWPECQLGHGEIVISSYPFAYSSVFPGNVSIPVTRVDWAGSVTMRA